VALALIAIAKRRTGERIPGTTTADRDRQRIRAFWELFNKATTLRLHGDFAEAADSYRQGLRLNPEHEDSLYYLGSCLEELGEYREAATGFRRLISLNPSSGRAFSELGNILSVLAPGAPADFEGAREAYSRSIQINREQAGPFLRLGILELNQGRYRPALDNFKIAAGSGSPEGSFFSAYVLFLEGQYRESLRPLHKVLGSYAKDRKIIGRGVLSEGDVLPAPGKRLTALERSALSSMLLLRWVSVKLGGYPPGTPQEFQLSRLADAAKAPAHPFTRVPAKLGSGRAVAADFDHDGYPGLVLTGRGSGVRLYRNQGGNFRDVTRAAGLSRAPVAWDATWVDYDGDGYPDLYLVRPGYMGTGQNTLYHNDRNGTFTDVTAGMGLGGSRSTARACFFDFDGDGRVDLVEVGQSDTTHSSVRLFRNTGSRFAEQTSVAGLTRSETAVDCTVSDVNGNGRPDLFVLFWRKDAVLFANGGNGRFLDATGQAGLKGIRGEGVSAVFFDYDNDRHPDLLITTHAPFEEVARCLVEPGYRTNRHTARLFRNRGDGSFEEVTGRVGLNRSYGTMQVVAADLDMDGWTDLVLVNGSLDAERLEPSVALRNLQGQRFEEWFYLPGFDAAGNFIGAAVADFNRDGKPDIFLAPNSTPHDAGAPAGLFLNALSRRTERGLANRTHSAGKGSRAASTPLRTVTHTQD
ncbi:MAG: hypothetical protein DMG23_11115, partial [Acidobacteria bacterium]